MKRFSTFTLTLILISSLSFSVCFAQSGKTAKTVTMEMMLDEMVSFDQAANFPKPFYTGKMISSYDRRTVAPDKEGWFANNDGSGYVRLDTIEGRIERVMLETTGAGAVTRIWITTLNKEGMLRFYFDGEKTPRLEIPAYDMTKAPFYAGEALSLIHTNYTPDIGGKGGNTFMLPLPYQKGCRITFEEPNPNSGIPRYYEINYRTFEKGTKVETFSLNKVNLLKDKLADINHALLNPPTFNEGTKSEKAGDIKNNETLTLDLPQGVNAIKTLEINARCNKGDYGKMMRNLVLKITFDGKETVWVPLSDFSGGGLGAPKLNSWYLQADGKGNVLSRWVMPYKTGAKIEIENLFDYQVYVSVRANSTPWEWTPNTLYFHTSWKQTRGIHIQHYDNPTNDAEWNYTTLSGRGVFRGDLLSLFNYAPDWYGEGDEIMWVDNDTFPSHHGTGTEDHYNCSWAPVVPFYTPYGGAPRADNTNSSHGYNAFIRTRNLDDIPFNKSFRFDIETLGWTDGKADYAATCYWYGDLDTRVKETSGKDELLVNDKY